MSRNGESREEFRAYMKAANPTSGNQDERHLREAQVIAYYRGDVSEAEREAAESHLVGCEHCVALFRSARDFLEPASADDEEVTAAQTNDAWQSLLQLVETASPKNVGAGTTLAQGEFQRPRDQKFFLDSRITLAMAASLLISIGALGLLGWRYWQERQSRQQSQEAVLQSERKQRELEQRLSELEQTGDQLKREREQRLAVEADRDRLQDLLAVAQPSRLTIPVYPFRLSSERGADEDLRLRFTRGAQAVKLRLFRNKPYEFSEYAVELIDERGAVVREISRLRPVGNDGALNVLLNRGTFSTGKYKLRLFGQQGETKKRLGEYGLSVTVER
jgi:hypothetical protein